jgi:hypothetical protein
MKTVNYYGTANFQELPYTGRLALWQTGSKEDLDDSVADILLALPGFAKETDDGLGEAAHWVSDSSGRITGLAGNDGGIAVRVGRAIPRKPKTLVDFAGAHTTISSPLATAVSTITQEADGILLTAAPAAGQVMASRTTLDQTDLSAYTHFVIDVSFPDQVLTCSFRVTFYNAAISKSASWLVVRNVGIAKHGRMTFVLPKAEITAVGGFVAADWAAVQYLEIALDKAAMTVANAAERLRIHGFYLGGRTQPNVVLSFDDTNTYLNRIWQGYGNPTNRGVADYNIPITLYTIPSQFGLPGYADAEILEEMYGSGLVDFGVHGVAPMAHILSITWASGEATAVSALGAHGYTTGDQVPIYGPDPYELAGTKTITVINSTTFKYATSLPGTGSALGYITSPLMSAGVVGNLDAVKAEVEANLAILAQRGWTRGNEHFAFPYNAFTPPLVAMLTGLGFKTFRTSNRMVDGTTPTTMTGADGLERSSYEPVLGISSRPMLDVVELNESPGVTLAKVQAAITQAIKFGSTVHIYGHSIVLAADISGAASAEWAADTKFWPLLDWLVPQVVDGSVGVCGISDWYRKFA